MFSEYPPRTESAGGSNFRRLRLQPLPHPRQAPPRFRTTGGAGVRRSHSNLPRCPLGQTRYDTRVRRPKTKTRAIYKEGPCPPPPHFKPINPGTPGRLHRPFPPDISARCRNAEYPVVFFQITCGISSFLRYYSGCRNQVPCKSKKQNVSSFSQHDHAIKGKNVTNNIFSGCWRFFLCLWVPTPRRIKLSMCRGDYGDEWKKPFYWAPVVVFGDAR